MFNWLYPYEDARGRYQFAHLTALMEPRHLSCLLARGSEAALPWRCYAPHLAGAIWVTPLVGTYADWIERELIPRYTEIESVHARLDALASADLLLLPMMGDGMPTIKRYLAAYPEG